jgi:hypothetical protein
VIAGYLGDKPWSFIELVCMTHASWRYINALEGAERWGADLVCTAGLPHKGCQQGYSLDV